MTVEECEQGMIDSKWHAGSHGELDNPWLFLANKTFVTLRDGHHGVWKVVDKDGKKILEMRWKSVDGKADYEL